MAAASADTGRTFTINEYFRLEHIDAALKHYDENKGLRRKMLGDSGAIKALREFRSRILAGDDTCDFYTAVKCFYDDGIVEDETKWGSATYNAYMHLLQQVLAPYYREFDYGKTQIDYNLESVKSLQYRDRINYFSDALFAIHKAGLLTPDNFDLLFKNLKPSDRPLGMYAGTGNSVALQRTVYKAIVDTSPIHQEFLDSTITLALEKIARILQQSHEQALTLAPSEAGVLSVPFTAAATASTGVATAGTADKTPAGPV